MTRHIKSAKVGNNVYFFNIDFQVARTATVGGMNAWEMSTTRLAWLKRYF